MQDVLQVDNVGIYIYLYDLNTVQNNNNNNNNYEESMFNMIFSNARHRLYRNELLYSK